MKEYKNSKGKYHRTDGPAVEYTDGSKEWYLHGKLHRTDGPAIDNGYKVWYLNGKKHRTDGPAVEDTYGHKEYWVKGVQYPYLPSTEEILTREIIE